MEAKPKTHEANGQFAKGWGGGPGRPKGSKTLHRMSREAGLYEKHRLTYLYNQGILVEESPAIIRKLVEKAKEGDLFAIKMVLERVQPAPTLTQKALIEQIKSLEEVVDKLILEREINKQESIIETLEAEITSDDIQ